MGKFNLNKSSTHSSFDGKEIEIRLEIDRKSNNDADMTYL